MLHRTRSRPSSFWAPPETSKQQARERLGEELVLGISRAKGRPDSEEGRRWVGLALGLESGIRGLIN
ncbi:hypothetical protein HPP92_025296 [Vanilla planifolia]|uniref:Uncharacterized protein n=1 Tax=Vanilla planifolia TaxID=51239 RepID=A0A835PM04_VANPL|nr:hypothetical protein HPP92_025296 [Vanilla planifolia]